MGTFFSFLILGCLASFAVAGLSMAPWVPTKKNDVKRFLEVLNMSEWEKFLEIGTWDGRVAMAVAQKYHNNYVVGIELAPPIFFLAFIRKFFSGNTHNLRYVLGNAFSLNFWDYEHIYVFWMPDKMQKKIVPKFMSEASKGAKLYSYVFSIPEEFRASSISYGQEHEAKIHILEKK